MLYLLSFFCFFSFCFFSFLLLLECLASCVCGLAARDARAYGRGGARACGRMWALSSFPFLLFLLWTPGLAARSFLSRPFFFRSRLPLFPFLGWFFPSSFSSLSFLVYLRSFWGGDRRGDVHVMVMGACGRVWGRLVTFLCPAWFPGTQQRWTRDRMYCIDTGMRRVSSAPACVSVSVFVSHPSRPSHRMGWESSHRIEWTNEIDRTQNGGTRSTRDSGLARSQYNSGLGVGRRAR